MVHAEADEAAHVLGGVVGHVGVTDLALDEDELVGILNDVVFVFEQNNIAVCIDDAGEAFAVTERTGG